MLGSKDQSPTRHILQLVLGNICGPGQLAHSVPPPQDLWTRSPEPRGSAYLPGSVRAGRAEQCDFCTTSVTSSTTVSPGPCLLTDLQATELMLSSHWEGLANGSDDGGRGRSFQTEWLSRFSVTASPTNLPPPLVLPNIKLCQFSVRHPGRPWTISHAFTGPYYVPSPLSPWMAKALVIQSMFCKA